MIYWVTGTAGSSARLYFFLSIPRFAKRDNTNILQWSEFERGGHFASLEVPDLYVGDVRKFFRRFR